MGKFELAGGGTLFLNEIGDLELGLQAKLLRAIQEEEVERVGGTKPLKTDFRLVVATNVDLEKAVRDGQFREDLFYRINVIPLKLPQLRERKEDLPDLVQLFLRRYVTKFRKEIEGITDGRSRRSRSITGPATSESSRTSLSAWSRCAIRNGLRRRTFHSSTNSLESALKPATVKTCFKPPVTPSSGRSSCGPSSGPTGTSPRRPDTWVFR